MNDVASFDAIMQCNLLEVFCEALEAAIIVTDKLDQLTFASVRLLQFFPIREAAIEPGSKARDLYAGLFDAGCRFGKGADERGSPRHRDEWVAERIAGSWKERTDMIDQIGPDKWIRIVSRRFSSGLGFVVMQDVSEQKKKEALWRAEQERVRLTEEILDSLPVAISVKDRNLTYAAVNRDFCRIHNVEADDILGRSVWDLVVPELAEQLEERDWKLLSSGEECREPLQLHRPDGSELNLHYRARRIGKPGQNYIVASFTEFEPSGHMVVKTTEAPAKPVQAAQGREEPTTRGQPAPAGKQKRVLMLDGSRTDQTFLLKVLADRNVELCVLHSDDELRAFLPLAREHGLVIDYLFISSGGSPLAYNIASEAGIRVSVLEASLDEAELAAAILHALEPENRHAERAHVERVMRRSEQPMTQLSAGKEEPKPAAISIIAVEDSAVNQLVLTQLLGNTGIPFMIATTGQQALSLIKQHSPRLILADITLADMSLVDFAHDARKVAMGAVIIGIMPSDDGRSRATCLDAGLDGCFAKPMNAEVLEDYVRRHLLTVHRGAPNAA